ncbi:MAG TPA: PLP-dependent aminotransferase family protein [Gemmatimonadaceae bacterium]|nr:PLP-dependent aminotransferase family protein [Gemmatimonadaceae bacterium]
MPTTPLFIGVDPSLPEPLHTQVYRGLRSAIADGRLKQGQFLPSTRALATSLCVGRNTVLRAVDRLKTEGLAEGRVGSGVRVARPAPAAPDGASARFEARARSGHGTRAFEVGVPPLDVFPTRTWSRVAAQRWRRSTQSIIESAEPCGYFHLREVIADYVRVARGVACEADQVLITSGSHHAFEIVLRALLEPGDAVLTEDPGRPEVARAVISAGANPVPIPVDREGAHMTTSGRWSAARLAIVTPGCHFPSGVALSLRRRQQLVDWARANNAWIIEDDHYAETRFVGRPIPTIHSLDMGLRTVFVGSFAHLLFPSLRIGFAVLPASIRERIVAARPLSEQHTPTSTQAILADFIEQGHFARHLRRLREAIAERYGILTRALHVHCGMHLDPWPANAGVHVMGWLPPTEAESTVVAECARRGVVVQALGDFRQTPGRPGLVLGFGGWTPAQIVAGVKNLARALNGSGSAVARGSARATLNSESIEVAVS